MSTSGVNTGFAKCFILFMAVNILLQGCIYLALTIWGITMRKCSDEVTDISSKPFQFAMDLVYFLNEDCGNYSIKVPGLAETIALDVDFSKAKPVEQRIFIFFITYAFISCLWVVTSLAIITTLCGRITKNIHALCFWPWFLVVMAGSTTDAVATGFHVYDIINTTTTERTFKYLGITASEKTLEALSKFDAYFVTPAVIMTCLSSRVILIWLLNIFGCSFCLSLSTTLLKKNSSNRSPGQASVSTYPIVNRQHDIPSAQAQQPEIKRCNPVLPPLLIEHLQKNVSTTSHINQVTKLHNEVISETNLNSISPSSQELPSNANVATACSPAVVMASQYHQELSPLSPLNNRYSTANESFQFPIQNQKVSEELRGQLPWSYTSVPPPVTKKSQVYPEIPAPDYSN